MENSESSANYLIRSKGEPDQSDSEGFRYVKTYGGRSLVWTYSAQRAKHFSYTEACEVHRLLKEARTDSEVVPASTEANHVTPDPDKLVTEVTIRSFTDDDWKIRPGKSGKFYISRRRDGVLLKEVHIFVDYVAYEWTETEAESKEFGSLEEAQDFATEILLLQTYRDSEPSLK